MRNEVYANYHEKFVKNTIIYASLDTNLLYFSKNMTPKDLVSKKELKNLFEKGLIIDDGRNLYKPVKLSKNPETNEYNVVVYDETRAYVFSSEDSEVFPLSPTYNADTRVITIPDQDGVLYFKGSSETALVPGAQTALAIGVESVTITAKPDEGYTFDPESVFMWEIDTRIEVTPAEPTFNDSTGVITIPSKTGCVYKINGLVVQSGPQDPIAKDTEVVVTVVADQGYKLSAESVTQWTFQWSDIEVTPAAPTFNDSTGVITIPSETGCIYKINDLVVQSGPQEPIAKDTEVVVTVVADQGYKLNKDSIVEWTFEWSDIEVTTVAPTFNDTTGVITIPDVEGVIYKIGDTALVAGPQEPITKDLEVIVTATPDEGYKFSAESVTQWTFEWSD